MLGLSSYAPSVDDTVTLNTFYNWSYGQDVINAVVHEISEGAMGRVGGLGDQNSAWSTMDLFRYSSQSVTDYTDGRDGKTTYFSPTGSVLSSLSFNNEYNGTTKVNSGDTADFTQQDVFGAGITGETNTLSQTDIAMMDAIGWKPLDTKAPVPVITSEVLSSGKVTLTGSTAEANDTISVYDGTALLGTTTTASNGTWTFTTGTVSDVIHTYTATATDLAGNVGQSSNEAILGSTNADTLVGTSGNDIILGNGGNDKITGGKGSDKLTGGGGNDTFIYWGTAASSPASHDTITDFTHGYDQINLENIPGITAVRGVPTFQGKLTGSGNVTLNAHSVAYGEVGGNTYVLVTRRMRQKS